MKTKSVFLRIGCVAENVSTDAARSSREIFDLLKERANADRENLYLILFNAKWGIIGIELHSIGTINMAMVYTREILKSVILKNSTFAAIVHNHPSGDPEPSIEDRAMTVQVARALRLIDSRLVDHVIIGAMKFGVNNFYSFADHGDGELKRGNLMARSKLDNIQIERVTTEEIRERFPNLYREHSLRGIIATTTLFSPKANAQIYEYGGNRNGVRFVYGSRSLAERFARLTNRILI